jgi:hypothetical protein
MTEPMDEQYFSWLYETQVQVPGAPALPPSHEDFGITHWNLCRQMHKKMFRWTVPNDDNRAADGKFLRVEFISDTGAQPDPDWMELPCSFLEMLIALCKRGAFEAGYTQQWWFFDILHNLRLIDYNDRMHVWRTGDSAFVDRMLTRVIHRQYGPNGMGGLFPLRHPTQDQTKVEIWYQMSAYILENF